MAAFSSSLSPSRRLTSSFISTSAVASFWLATAADVRVDRLTGWNGLPRATTLCCTLLLFLRSGDKVDGAVGFSGVAAAALAASGILSGVGGCSGCKGEPANEPGTIGEKGRVEVDVDATGVVGFGGMNANPPLMPGRNPVDGGAGCGCDNNDDTSSRLSGRAAALPGAVIEAVRIREGMREVAVAAVDEVEMERGAAEWDAWPLTR